jgi:hypothetical protein
MSTTLTVTYTANYLGCHRICFKTTGEDYCCYTDTTDSTIGESKTVEIVLQDYEECLGTLPPQVGCDDYSELTGYVQPCCTEETSTDNRVPFTVQYPETPCDYFTVQCEARTCFGSFKVVDCNSDVLPTNFEVGFDTGTVLICAKSVSNNPGAIYTIVPNGIVPVTPGSCLLVNTDFNGNSNGWSSTAGWKFGGGPLGTNGMSFSGAPGFGSPGTLYQAGLVPGNLYNITFDLYATQDQCTGQSYLTVSAGNTQSAQYSSSQSVDIDLLCTGNGNLLFYAVENCLPGDAEIYIANVCVKLIGVPGSCCTCNEYDIYTTRPVDFYYQQCGTAAIKLFSAVSGESGNTLCAIPGSIFPVTPSDTEFILDITDNGPCN